MVGLLILAHPGTGGAGCVSLDLLVLSRSDSGTAGLPVPDLVISVLVVRWADRLEGMVFQSSAEERRS